jgi:hypothetical protein
VIPNKKNAEEVITLEYSKGVQRNTQPVKRKNYNSTKEKLERLGYSVKII